MIDDELFAKFDRIQDFPVSEEMLGAYIEDKLGDLDKLYVESFIANNHEVEDLLQTGMKVDNYDMSDSYNSDNVDIFSLSLPEIEESLIHADNIESSDFSLEDSSLELDVANVSSNDFSENTDFNHLDFHVTLEDEDFSDSSENFNNNPYE